jgi:hypothetical protein
MKAEKAMTSEESVINGQKTKTASGWIYGLLLVLILAAAAYLRFNGIDWDEGHLPHPDERFLIGVEGNIQPVFSISEYFNTHVSTLNPHNGPDTLFVYGSFPIFLLRYLREWLPEAGFSYTIAGRYMSASAEFLTVVFVYLVAARLYGLYRAANSGGAFLCSRYL